MLGEAVSELPSFTDKETENPGRFCEKSPEVPQRMAVQGFKPARLQPSFQSLLGQWLTSFLPLRLTQVTVS